jgi:hypothetical protein
MKIKLRSVILFLVTLIEAICLQSLPAGKQEIRWVRAARLPAGQYIARIIFGNGISENVRFTKQ